MDFRGARYLHILVPCPLGWGSSPADTVKVARLATESGLFPVFEAEAGEVTSSTPIRRQVPVTDYLRIQARYAHLFKPEETTEVIDAHPGGRRPQHPQVRAGLPWSRTGRGFRTRKPAGGRVPDGPRVPSSGDPTAKALIRDLLGLEGDHMIGRGGNDKPFAITLDVGSSRANHTGAWRTERPVYVHNLPPCNSACPAGENIQQWLYDAEEGPAKYEAAWRQIMQDNPFPAVMGRVCYRPCETACNRAQLDSAVGINSVERFLGDEALRQGWQVPVDAAPTGKRVLVVGAGPSGLSAAYHLARLGHSVTIKDAGAAAGGMMRYGIPKYRLPRDILDAEITRILDMGINLELNTTVTDIQAELDGGLRRRVRRGRRAHRQARLHPGRGFGPDHGRGIACCTAWKTAHRPCWAAGSRSTAAATPPWTPPAPPAASARPKPSWCTAGPATRCRPTTSRSKRRWRKASPCAGCPRSPRPMRASW